MILLSFYGSVIAILIILSVLGVIIIYGLFFKWLRKPIHGLAFVRTGVGGEKVSFDKAIFVIPILHRFEMMDITQKKVVIEQKNKNSVVCRDGKCVDLKINFFVKINHTKFDVLDVAHGIGCARTLMPEIANELFNGKFLEAIKTIAYKYDRHEFLIFLEEVKRELINYIGRDLSGYFLDDIAIEEIKATKEFFKLDDKVDLNSVKIKFVETLDNFKLFLIFENGIIRIYSIEEKIKDFNYKSLADLNFFRKVKIIEEGKKLNWKDIYNIEISAKESWENSFGITSIKKLEKEYRI